MYLADLLSRAARNSNIEETMAEQRVEMHVNTIIAADNMYTDGMLEELRKESSKQNNFIQALEEVGGGWAKKGKSYKGYLRRLYRERERT